MMQPCPTGSGAHFIDKEDDMLMAVLRVLVISILALLFITLPAILHESLPDWLFALWDGAVEPIRTPINAFWWQFFHRYDQQPWFQLSSHLTMVALITSTAEAVRWIWGKRAA